MQTWAAAAIVIGQGIFLLIALRILRAFGAYVDVLVETHKQNITIRGNIAAQQNENAITEILHTHRRSTDPLPNEEKEA